jgi:cobalt-zinc-cadmium efflux system protein
MHPDHTTGDASHLLGRALAVTAALVVIKAIGAWWSHSLALGADAAHSLGDVGALGLAWYADWQRRQPPTPQLTFGWGRVEVLVALLNAIVLWALAGGLVWEAILQWQHPTPSKSLIMALAAGIALIINAALAWGFRDPQDLNRRSTLWHLVTDAAGSLGVLIGAVILSLTGWDRVNSVITVVIAGLMVFGAWGIMRDTVRVLLEATPAALPIANITQYIESIPGVARVHDLHVWTVGSGQLALACHVNLSPTAPPSQEVLCQLHDVLAQHGIDHTTIQLETPAESHREPSW